MSNARFLRNAEARAKFLELEPTARITFFNGFKTGVIQSLRDREPAELHATLLQLDADYDDIVASGANETKQGTGESS